jgi:hypothetical protein
VDADLDAAHVGDAFDIPVNHAAAVPRVDSQAAIRKQKYFKNPGPAYYGKPVAEVTWTGKMGTGSHFRIDVGCCINELRWRKWSQSPFFGISRGEVLGWISAEVALGSRLTGLPAPACREL